MRGALARPCALDRDTGDPGPGAGGGASVAHWRGGYAGGHFGVEFLHGIGAVSYTHLDVYKRQPPHWPPAPPSQT